MKTEVEIKDIRNRIEVAFNDRKNPNSQHFMIQSIEALDWVLGEYDQWSAIEALKVYDESKIRKKKR